MTGRRSLTNLNTKSYAALMTTPCVMASVSLPSCSPSAKQLTYSSIETKWRLKDNRKNSPLAEKPSKHWVEKSNPKKEYGAKHLSSIIVGLKKTKRSTRMRKRSTNLISKKNSKIILLRENRVSKDLWRKLNYQVLLFKR